MRLHRYKAAEPRRLRLMVNRYAGEWPIGLALQRHQRVWSLVWRGPASMGDEKRIARSCPPAQRDGPQRPEWCPTCGAGWHQPHGEECARRDGADERG